MQNKQTFRTVISAIFILTLVCLGPATLSAQKLSRDEQRIVDYIDSHDKEAIDLLERSVNIESPTEDLAGVRSVGALFGEQFKALGMTALDRDAAGNEACRSSRCRDQRKERQANPAARPHRHCASR